MRFDKKLRNTKFHDDRRNFRGRSRALKLKKKRFFSIFAVICRKNGFLKLQKLKIGKLS